MILERIGIVGHSLGGATAAQFCHDDAQCKAGIDIDGIPFGSVVQESLHQPFFFILSDHRMEKPGPESRIVKGKVEAIFSKLPAETRWQIMIDGANHFSFSDQMFTKSPVMLRGLRMIGAIGPLEKRRGIEIAYACSMRSGRLLLKVQLRQNHLTYALPSIYREVHARFRREHFPQGSIGRAESKQVPFGAELTAGGKPSSMGVSQ